jgi:apolipoprotein N-acyltransferase
VKRLKRFLSLTLQSFIPRKAEGIALGLGLFSVLAFAPFHFAPAGLVGLVGLFWLWQQAESKFAGFKLGLWFGLGLFGLGVSWLFSSVYVYGHVALPLAILAVFIFILFLSLYVAFAGAMAVVVNHRLFTGFSLVVMFPAVWVLFEWLRSTLFGGFPFLVIGNSHLDTWLDGYAPVFGVLGVSWAVAATAGLLLWLYQKKAWTGASIGMAILWLTGSGLQEVEWVKPKGEPVKVALIQANIPQDKKWESDQFFPTLKRYVKLTQQNLSADIIVWPETAVPSYLDMVQKGALKQFIADAQLLETDIIAGIITREPDHQHYYNSIVNFHNPKQVYSKHHLVPFSEYFPFGDALYALSQLFDIPFSQFTKGAYPPKTMKLAGHDVGLSVCFETAFGEELAELIPPAEMMITVSNDAWFAHTFEPAQQMQEVQMRALELGREFARSTNTGITAIVDVKGRIKQQIPPYEEGVLVGKLQPYEGQTFFAEWKQLPLLFMLSLIFSFYFGIKFILRGKIGQLVTKK